jgi:GxxExxY protein
LAADYYDCDDFYDKVADNFAHSSITSQIIGCFFKVYNKLGFGFLERVYQNALQIELTQCGLEDIMNYPVDVYYYDDKVGFYLADIVVNNCVIIENKAAESLCPNMRHNWLII